MTRADAISKLGRILGKHAYWRIGEHVTSPERRRDAHLERLNVEFQTAMLARDMTDRANALLGADLLYQTLKADHARAKAAKVKLPIMPAYRFEVGTTSDIGLGSPIAHIKAWGDTWEEVFTMLATKGK